MPLKESYKPIVLISGLEGKTPIKQALHDKLEEKGFYPLESPPYKTNNAIALSGRRKKALIIEEEVKIPNDILKSVPTLVVGNDATGDKAAFFLEKGAQDYISTAQNNMPPEKLAEFTVLKLGKILERIHNLRNELHQITLGNLKVNYLNGRYENPYHTGHMRHELISYLNVFLENPNKVIPHDTFLKLHNIKSDLGHQPVARTIIELKKILEGTGYRISNVWGEGYKLEKTGNYN